MSMMTSFLALLTLSTIFINITTFFHLLSPTSCLNPQDIIQGLLVEEKTRLGSTPPSCHNKCNNCHPCMAVQVPTTPSHNRVQPGLTRATTMDHNNFDSSSPSSAIGNNRAFPVYGDIIESLKSEEDIYNSKAVVFAHYSVRVIDDNMPVSLLT
ncbi:hypothetical protein ACH5RR_012285 [Cinchona calisaya]|uniref:Epidermal patterning factor-like protein n=1 Tax=Cinchona calisaya TaxID=153742 RepID=A0ABD3A8V4_9GENT